MDHRAFHYVRVLRLSHFLGHCRHVLTITRPKEDDAIYNFTDWKFVNSLVRLCKTWASFSFSKRVEFVLSRNLFHYATHCGVYFAVILFSLSLAILHVRAELYSRDSGLCVRAIVML